MRLEAWEIFFTVYRDERRRGLVHTQALASTIAAWANDHRDTRQPAIKKSLLEGLVTEIEQWRKQDEPGGWSELRQRLRQVWIDNQ